MQLFEGQQKLSVLSKMYHIIISYSESHRLVDFYNKFHNTAFPRFTPTYEDTCSYNKFCLLPRLF